MKLALEKICNTRFDEFRYTVSSLPCRRGGLGIRKVEDIMLPSFLSSVCSTSSLINLILSGNTTDLVDVAHFSKGLDIWKILNEELSSNHAVNQHHWSQSMLI